MDNRFTENFKPQPIHLSQPGSCSNERSHFFCRVRNGLLLHRDVDDGAFELASLDHRHRRGRFDGGLEQLLDTGLAQHAASAADLRGVAR